MIPALWSPSFQRTPGTFRSQRRMHMSSFGIITVLRTALDDEERSRGSILVESNTEDPLSYLILKRNALCAFTIFLSREPFQTSIITVLISISVRGWRTLHTKLLSAIIFSQKSSRLFIISPYFKLPASFFSHSYSPFHV